MGKSIRTAGDAQAAKVDANDNAVIFTTSLKPGRTKLQTWLLDAEGKEIVGAYYVYVERR